MKKLLIYGLTLVLLATSSFSFTSCIDETEPTSGATEDQVQESDKALEAMVLGLNNQFIKIWNSSYHWSIGYGALMIIRNIQSGEMPFSTASGYCQWRNWQWDLYWGRDYLTAQFMWQYQTGFVRAINNVIASADGNENDEAKGVYGIAHAFRALLYLDMAREYEFLENDKTEPKSPEGMDISGLTVPIVTEKTTETESRNNPRATREDMVNFILSDLKIAEDNISYASSDLATNKTMPGLDCVYGLYARLYMWIENYPEAEKYARKAIDASRVDIMSKDDCLNVMFGFNDKSKWMWGTQYSDGNVSNIINWAAFMTTENTYGYSGPLPGGAEAYPMIDALTYARISDTDWRKLEFQAPQGSPLYGQNTYCDNELGETIKENLTYAALKFRPAGGNVDQSTKGNVTAFPIMRIEEMYLIEAEAAAHQNVNRGKTLLKNFMLTRDENYDCDYITTAEDLVEEIVFQKKVELWGEGQSWFDIKRLDYPVTKSYTGTNWDSNGQFNTLRRPAWMNWAMVISEETNNAGVKFYNNPDPAGHY